MEKQPRVWCYRVNREQPLGNGDLPIKKCCESPVTISRVVLNGCATFKKGGKNSRPLKKLRQQCARQRKPVDLRAFISDNLVSVKQLFLLRYHPVCSASAPTEEITNLLCVIHVHPKTNHMLRSLPVSCVIIRVINFCQRDFKSKKRCQPDWMNKQLSLILLLLILFLYMCVCSSACSGPAASRTSWSTSPVLRLPQTRRSRWRRM